MRPFMRLSSQGLISAAILAAVLATLLIATTEAFVGRPPKTNKILPGAHIGYATIIMISSVDTDQAEVKFKREFDDVIEECMRSIGTDEQHSLPSDEVAKCTKEDLREWGDTVVTRRADCARPTLFMEDGNYSLIDYVREEHDFVRTNWKNQQDDTMVGNCSACRTPELVATYRILCPSRYKEAFDGWEPY
jgi:hypothetical protein